MDQVWRVGPANLEGIKVVRSVVFEWAAFSSIWLTISILRCAVRILWPKAYMKILATWLVSSTGAIVECLSSTKLKYACII